MLPFKNALNKYFVLGIASAALALVVYLYYQTPVSQHVEDYFFDLRTRLKPPHETSESVVIVTIDDRTIHAMEGELAQNLSYDGLLRIMRALKGTEASAIVTLFLSNIFDYDDTRIYDVAAEAAADRRIILGTLNFNFPAPILRELPPALASVSEQVYGADTLRKRSNSVVRSLPFTGYRKDEEVMMLAPAVAYRIGDIFGEPGDDYYLNYRRHGEIPSIAAEDLVKDPGRYHAMVKDKVVVVGYTVFRPWNYETFDQMVANTPLKGDYNQYKEGDSITFITAVAIDNLLEGSWLHQAGPIWNMIQTVVVTLIGALVWRLGTLLASFAVVVLWLVLLFVHSLLFSYFAVMVPLADTFLFSSIAILGGAVIRLQSDLSTLASEKAKAEANEEVASIQSQFLDAFARGLKGMTGEICTAVGKIRVGDELPPAMHQVHQKTLESCREFSEYLDGVISLSDLEARRFERPDKKLTQLRPIIDKVASRFDHTLAEKEMELVILCDADASWKTSAQLVDTILYNFVSNAIKYSPAKTTVTVEAQTAADGRLCIAVSDEGPGIPAEFQEKIFQQFYRIKNDDVYRVKGTGIGLYLCRFFAAKIGGTVTVDSTVGRGSTFSLWLH